MRELFGYETKAVVVLVAFVVVLSVGCSFEGGWMQI
jgi:hypothetical protein